MLTSYQNLTAQLLQNPAAPTALYGTPLLTTYINIARGQLAGETGCIRVIGTLTTVIGQQSYPLSSIVLPTASGIAGVLRVNTIWLQLPGATGQGWLTPRPFEWFSLYSINNLAPVNGPPTSWSQYAQGAAPPAGGAFVGGSIFFDPIPDLAYPLQLDCACYPIALATDSTREAIPFLWTDAVPFFAAYFALLSAQTSARTRDAGEMLQYYNLFVRRALLANTPTVSSWMYQGASDPVTMAKLNLGQKQPSGQ